MDASDLLHDLNRAGLTVTAEGGRLAIRPAARLTDSLRAQMRAAKAELLALLDAEARREAFEERAAVMEYDGGLSREDAERAAIESIRAEVRTAAETLAEQVRAELGLSDAHLHDLGVDCARNPYWALWALRQLRAACEQQRGANQPAGEAAAGDDGML